LLTICREPAVNQAHSQYQNAVKPSHLAVPEHIRKPTFVPCALLTAPSALLPDSRYTESPGFAAGARQIAGKPAPTAFGQNQAKSATTCFCSYGLRPESKAKSAAICFCPEGVGVQLVDDLPGTGSKPSSRAVSERSKTKPPRSTRTHPQTDFRALRPSHRTISPAS